LINKRRGRMNKNVKSWIIILLSVLMLSSLYNAIGYVFKNANQTSTNTEIKKPP